jgi:glutathione S-transferase
MTITITAFERSPDGGKGLARDTRVRWALEEVGQPYEVRPVSFRAMKEPAHLALHPFGQIPTYEEGELALWMFAALSSVEPPILDLGSPSAWEMLTGSTAASAQAIC